MTEEINTLLSLPLGTLAVLAAGYLGYRVAYAGRDTQHGSIDVVFFVCVFGFVAKLSAALVIWAGSQSGSDVNGILAALGALIGALAISAIWRGFIEENVFSLLRGVKVSSARRLPSAWLVVASRPNLQPSILIVTKTDGSQLMSEGMSQFDGLPFASCILGQDGSVAMYVTHARSSNSEDWIEVSSGPYEDWGAEVTVVPSGQISQVALRSI